MAGTTNYYGSLADSDTEEELITPTVYRRRNVQSYINITNFGPNSNFRSARDIWNEMVEACKKKVLENKETPDR